MALSPINRLYEQLSGLVEGKLWVRVLFGLFLGIGVGGLLGPSAEVVSPDVARMLTSWLALPGDLFIRMVQMIMIPLVVASIIQGIAGQGDRDQVARLGARVGLYFIATTVGSIVIGLAAALLLRPGRGASLSVVATSPATPASPTRAADVPALISGLLPTNPLASVLAGEMLSIVIFAIIVGAALVSMARERAEPVLSLMFSVQEICMTVTKWAMKLAPYAVFGLMARSISASGLAVIASLGLYILTVLASLAVIMAINAVLIGTLTSIKVRRFFHASKDALLLAFSTASSAAVMPLTMKTAEDKLKVPSEITRFVVPVGTILNMNGTAAYQAVATVFLAQVYGLNLTIPTLALILVTTVAASIGTPSAPGAGIIILASVLTSVGIPPDGISVILGVDHLLGMCRTSVNVAADLVACALFMGKKERTEGEAGETGATPEVASVG
ncbi:dicarboxylate/amino acid:cation symporter [Chondromyces crocatus]|uniref:Sodium:dicarboxylate symporter n=1 Tax=Chondromyces crocatus TaxID=52 RepID=A0A0K1EBC4_CHOCO|nr:dicarboxylate/amino acid:cation symporter [Chondromyces crocatus]AKT38160.1 sodium:dicarboxylate symporter [Chondromyces crocatus]